MKLVDAEVRQNLVCIEKLGTMEEKYNVPGKYNKAEEV